MKKKFALTLTIVTSLFIVGCSSASGNTESNEDGTKIRMALDTAAGGSLQIRAAEDQGYFENQGIDAQISNFAMGIDTVNAVLTEQADTGGAADFVALNSVAKGDMVIIATATRANEKSSKETQLLVREDIASPSDLKGKKLGVSKGTVYEYVWDRYLEKHHIAENDITFVPYSTPDEAIVGMQNGDIDAVWQGGALRDKFLDIDGVHSIDDLLGAGVSIDAYLLANKSFVEQNPKVIENALKAINEGVEYVENNPEETAKLAFEELKITEKDALKDIERTNYVLGFTEEDAAHLEDMKKWMEENGILEDSYELDDKLYLNPLRNALPESVTY